MKQIIAILVLVVVIVTTIYAQQQNAITSRCPNPNQSADGSARVFGTGDIYVTPCPTRRFYFTDNVTPQNQLGFININKTFQNETGILAAQRITGTFKGGTGTIVPTLYVVAIAQTGGHYGQFSTLRLANSINGGSFETIQGLEIQNSTNTANISVSAFRAAIFLKHGGSLGTYPQGDYAILSKMPQESEFAGAMHLFGSSPNSNIPTAIPLRITLATGQIANAVTINNSGGSFLSGFDNTGRMIGVNATPSAATDACNTNTVWFDENFIYFCVASGNIKRAAIATW